MQYGKNSAESKIFQENKHSTFGPHNPTSNDSTDIQNDISTRLHNREHCLKEQISEKNPNVDP